MLEELTLILKDLKPHKKEFDVSAYFGQAIDKLSGFVTARNKRKSELSYFS
jgi:hypothetical protein